MALLAAGLRRGLAGAAILVAAAAPLLVPSPAKAWWARGGWRPAPVVVARPPVYVGPRFGVAAYPAPVVPYAPRVWVPAHWTRRGAWVPGHWR